MQIKPAYDRTSELTQPVQARIDAIETLRRQHWQGVSGVSWSIQKVYRILQLKNH